MSNETSKYFITQTFLHDTKALVLMWCPTWNQYFLKFHAAVKTKQKRERNWSLCFNHHCAKWNFQMWKQGHPSKSPSSWCWAIIMFASSLHVIIYISVLAFAVDRVSEEPLPIWDQRQLHISWKGHWGPEKAASPWGWKDLVSRLFFSISICPSPSLFSSFPFFSFPPFCPPSLIASRAYIKITCAIDNDPVIAASASPV